MAQHSKVLDRNRNLLGFLPNATLSYTLKGMPLHTAKFTMSVDDPANAYCQVFNLVELYDDDRRVELFRIIEVSDAVYTKKGGTITYKCEHVLAELIEAVLPDYHEVGGWGGDNHVEDTPFCLNYVLGFQDTPNWVLKRCDFTRHFQYSWEDETVLRALLSIPNRLEDEYMFTFDTTVYPWEISLIQLEKKTDCELRYSRNLHEITKSVDAKEVVTRLIPRGYGEGVNRLNIRDVNDGVDYLDADTQNLWGLKTKVWTDGRFEVAQSLMERAQAILNELKNPYISYKVKASDIYRLTGEPFDEFKPGKYVRVIDHEHGIVFVGRVVEITKGDVHGKPADITITIANKAKTVADTISQLADRASIQELYAQGATNVDSKSFADNADRNHPATLSVYIPQECVRINRAVLRWKLAPFRSYSTGASAGGGSTYASSAGGGSTPTSSAGGGGATTSQSDGGSTQTSSMSGQAQVTSEPSSKTTVSISSEESSVPSNGYAYTGDQSVSVYGFVNAYSGNTDSAYGSSSHSHGMNHIHSYTSGSSVTGSPTRTATESAGGSSSHYHSMAHGHTVQPHNHSISQHKHLISHSHNIDHTHTVSVPSHYHSVTIPAHSHTVNLPEHTHSVTIPEHIHEVTIPAHTHPLIAGIFDGKSVNQVTVRVDGVEVPMGAIQGNELDIIQYLGKDDLGKILRNAWHDIEITPVATDNNADGLTRIVADLSIQTFVRSQGGGNY